MLKIYIYPAYVSKHKPNREKQVILLMIPNREGWNYLAVEKLSAFSRGITSKHYSDFYCKNHIWVRENDDFYDII